MRRSFTLILCCLLFKVGWTQRTLEREVYFDFNSSNLRPKTILVLDSMVSMMEQSQLLTCSLEGHCDHVGGIPANQTLSDQRIAAIATYLRGSGWKTKPEQKSFGKTSPKYSAETPNYDAKNRRVLIKITYEEKPVKKPVVKAPEPPPAPATVVVEEVPEEKAPEKLKALSTDEVKVGDRFQLENLNFYPGTANVLPSSEAALKQLYNALKLNENLEVMIEGHVCCNPDMELSIDRAKAVRAYLLDKGIKKKRMQIEGFANTRPLVPETTEENRITNRRVEIRVLNK